MYNRLNDEIKQAMIEKNIDKKDVLKQIKSKSEALAKEDTLNGINKDINSYVQDAATKELKQLNQTLDAIKSKPESDLYKSTVYKIEIVKSYLPTQMSEDEIKAKIERIKSENADIDNKGRLTGIIMKELKGKADNATIAKIIKEIL